MPQINIRAAITDYCAAIGKDIMLVQGAGGNVSWKEKNTLWIKASGTWLADATSKDIFVPVDLIHLQAAIASKNFTVVPKLQFNSALRPSIETLLHALMPHPVVVHLHAVEILAYLVRNNFESEILRSLDNHLRWITTDYWKPGPSLAEAVNIALTNVPEVDVVFLKNHGVVIGGSNILEVDHILRILIAALITQPRNSTSVKPPNSALILKSGKQYLPVSDPKVHQLATDEALFNRLSSNWALYPDHVVFLGSKPTCYANLNEAQTILIDNNNYPELIFIKNTGVFTIPEFNITKQAQLRCYYDVLSRQTENCILNTLSDMQIAELLNWDAEQYRMHLLK
jgi:rhamnose utilization protein RhaD (predicted bifunctional aldolase and dehydrogenase)